MSPKVHFDVHRYLRCSELLLLLWIPHGRSPWAQVRPQEMGPSPDAVNFSKDVVNFSKDVRRVCKQRQRLAFKSSFESIDDEWLR
jgi:hypothetical protein